MKSRPAKDFAKDTAAAYKELLAKLGAQGAQWVQIDEPALVKDIDAEDIALFAKHVGPNVRIKAAGGISTIADAEKFVELGATRLGTSRIIKILKAENIAPGTY